MAENRTDDSPKYWLDIAVAEIIKKYPQGEIVVSSGISPSASYHIGHFREILTADALTWGIQQAGRKAKHIHVVDNFDPLRKRYHFLPESYEQYVGQPICLIPSPHGDGSYADYFFSEFERYAHKMGIYPDEVVRSYEHLYKPGKMTECIEDVLKNDQKVKDIFERVSNRKLPDDWTPVQVIKEDGTFKNGQLGTWNQKKQTIDGIDYSAGKAKLNWRLDWPARWKVLGVQVEPFSYQEHGAAGGSYDTGVEFSKDIFHNDPPIPAVQYGNIHLPGDTKKMSSSKGNLITPEQALEIMPTEILRYFVVRSKPDKTIYFDSGEKLYNLIDEFSQIENNTEHEYRDAYNFAIATSSGKKSKRIISSVPFKHLVTLYQTAQGKLDGVQAGLTRTGYQKEVDEQADIIKNELAFIKNWLKKYAPDSIKFEVQKQLPEIKLDDDQEKFLGKLVGELQKNDFEPEAIHASIYETAVACNVKPGDAFKLIYQLFITKDSGPKAGYFLASLDKQFVLDRLSRKA